MTQTLSLCRPIILTILKRIDDINHHLNIRSRFNIQVFRILANLCHLLKLSQLETLKVVPFHFNNWLAMTVMENNLPNVTSDKLEQRLSDSAPTPGCLGYRRSNLFRLASWIANEISSNFLSDFAYLLLANFIAVCRSVTFCFWCWNIK